MIIWSLHTGCGRSSVSGEAHINPREGQVDSQEAVFCIILSCGLMLLARKSHTVFTTIVHFFIGLFSSVLGIAVHWVLTRSVKPFSEMGTSKTLKFPCWCSRSILGDFLCFLPCTPGASLDVSALGISFAGLPRERRLSVQLPNEASAFSFSTVFSVLVFSFSVCREADRNS